MAAQQLIEAEMAKHGLGDWRFRWGSTRHRIGCCRWWQKTIEISLPFVLVADAAEVLDTVLHEIAHALVKNEAVAGQGELGLIGLRAHGPEWRAMACKLGARPRACTDHWIPIARPIPRRRLPDARQGWFGFMEGK